MATPLNPVDGREVLRCDGCRLVQFARRDRRCPRCGEAYDPPPDAAREPGAEHV